MAEIRIHEAWAEIEVPPPQIRIHEAWAKVTSAPESRQLRIHGAWGVVGPNSPVTAGGVFVYTGSGWVPCTVWVWNGTEWV